MRIYSKKAFALGPGARPNTDVIEQIVTVPGAFQDIPDSYANDNMFKLALKAGDITIVERKVTVPVDFVPAEPEKPAEPVKEEEKHDDFKESLKLAKPEDVKKLAAEYGAEYVEGDKLSENKKRVYEAYKIELADAE